MMKSGQKIWLPTCCEWFDVQFLRFGHPSIRRDNVWSSATNHTVPVPAGYFSDSIMLLLSSCSTNSIVRSSKCYGSLDYLVQTSLSFTPLHCFSKWALLTILHLFHGWWSSRCFWGYCVSLSSPAAQEILRVFFS